MLEAKILAAVRPAHGRGLEIGALHRPIVSRSLGNVEYVDRATQQELRQHYADDRSVSLADIVNVDHVWGKRSLLECVGGQRAYDYVVASHVIEHVPDFFGWLREIAEVLVDNGHLALIIPNKLLTFDAARQPSSEAEFVDAYVRRLRRPDPRQIFDSFYHWRDLLGGHYRDAPASGEGRAAELLERCARAHKTGEYVDVHCWVFTPQSFLRALDLGSRLGLLPFEVATLEPSEAGRADFLAILRRTPEALTADERRARFVRTQASLTLPGEPGAQDPDAEVRLALLEARAAHAHALENSLSWRITAPLRAARPLRSLVTRARRLAMGRLSAERNQQSQRS